jgi:uncharacterized protein (TIGR02246 family)
MSLHSPSATVRTFVDAMTRGDLDAAFACYAPDAVFVAEPGQTLRDPVAIRHALGGMLSIRPTLVTTEETTLEIGDIALYHSAWTMTGKDPTDAEIQMSGRSSDVLCRQTDGRWLIVVDNPWGTAVLGSGV